VVPYDTLCGECRVSGKRFGICRSAGLYEGQLKECIHLFKYEGRVEMAKALGSFMDEFARRELREWEIDAVVPVPLHRAKRRVRGFNQALLLAREIGRHMDVDVRGGVLRRVRRGESQSTLKRAERMKNIRGVFSLVNRDAVRGLRLLLVDDVFTTGATAEECVKVLLEGGAKRVDVFTAARGA
jgi:ComF family protein